MKKGFTLIELLIVIVIIGILSTLIMANFVGVRQRARDGQRKADLRQIQGALELYRSDVGSYPLTAFSCVPGSSKPSIKSGSSIYLQQVPCDPLISTDYQYASDGTTYTLIACLENTNDGSKDSPDRQSASNCPDASYTVQNP